MNIPYRTLGEIIIDFLVFTAPLPTAVEIKGGYWHRNTFADLRRESKIKRYFKGQVRVISVDSDKIPSVDEAIKFARSELIT
jgi:hypothetical protein